MADKQPDGSDPISENPRRGIISLAELQHLDLGDDDEPVNCWTLLWKSDNLASVDLGKITDVDSDVMVHICEEWVDRASMGHPATGAKPVSLPVGNTLWTKATKGEERILPWPVPLVGTDLELWLVLREWAEDEPDPRLAEQLKSLPQWHQISITENDDAMFWSHFGQETWHFGCKLERLGLPATPTTVHYVFATLKEERYRRWRYREPPVGPTRGVCVHTFCLRPRENSKRLRGGVTVHTFNAVYPWVTIELYRRAAEVARKHANWWKSLPGSGLLAVTKHAGRPRDELGELALACARGDISFDEALERAKEQAEAEMGRRLPPVGMAKERKRLRALVDHYRRKIRKG